MLSLAQYSLSVSNIHQEFSYISRASTDLSAEFQFIKSVMNKLDKLSALVIVSIITAVISYYIGYTIVSIIGTISALVLILAFIGEYLCVNECNEIE